MTTEVPTITRDTSYELISWAALANGEAGVKVTTIAYEDLCVQVTGTFGAGGSVNLEGSNDGTNFVILTNPGGTALTFTSAGLAQVTEIPRFLRPHCTGGDGTTALLMSVWARLRG